LQAHQPTEERNNIAATEPLAVVKTPSLPTTGQIGMKEMLGIQEPYMKEKARLIPEISAAKGRVEEAKQAQQEIGAQGEVAATKGFATAEKGAMQQYQGKMEREPLPAFVPSKENAEDLATLFSLVGVIGMLVGGGGKQNAQQAMSAMNGMLEGHQKGRADLYKQELSTFDKNFKSMVQKHAEFRKEMEDAVKLASTDKEGAMADAKLAAVKAGSNIVKAMLDQGRLMDGYKLLDESQTGVDEAVAAEAKIRADAEKEKQAERRHRESLAHTEKMRKLADQHAEKMKRTEGATFNYFTKPDGTLVAINTKNPNDIRTINVDLREASKLGASRGGGAQETALRVMQQDIGNAKYNLEDLKKLSEPTGKLPGGSVAFAQKFTGDMTSMLMRYAANQNIDEGLQAIDALMLNLAFDIASAQSGGRGQLSDAKVRAVVSQMPLDEQPESTKATKWAALLVRVEEANKTLPEGKRVEIPAEVKAYYSRGRATGNIERIEKPNTQEEYNALPKGTRYIDPDDGKEYRKK